ncbi:hypothetical protein J5N97_028742 [Dioscorea zingiberensis]|uniref:PUM-HD domain-containing protein n=1 Tax=Dioscorea zingiberensis TaxID=325984 RepID=A0A9D5BZE9_9LILI|nr:hypothetical protein J5N97_028742 [Dioscorea zingiberensis]
MVSEGSVKMAPAPAANGGFEDFERDLEAVLREQQHQSRAALDRERELNPYRSGSAPPTVEGSRRAVGSLFGVSGQSESFFLDNHDAGEMLSEEEMRSHPAYLSYYYSNENLNPRLPPPMVSKEDWRMAQRFHGFGGIGDRRKKESWEGDGGSSSLFSLQPGVSPALPQQQQSHRGANAVIGLPDVGLGTRRKSFADVVQEEFNFSTSMPAHHSRPVSRNAFNNVVDPIAVSDSQHTLFHSESESLEDLRAGEASANLVRVKSLGSAISHSFASAVRSPVRSTTPDLPPIGRSPSPSLPSMGGRLSDTEKKTLTGANGLGGVSAHTASGADVVAALSGLSLAKTIVSEGGGNHVQGQLRHKFADQRESLLNMPGDHEHYLRQKIIEKSEDKPLNMSTDFYPGYTDFSKRNGALTDLDLLNLASNGQINLQKQSSSSNLYRGVAPVGSNTTPGSSQYQAADIQQNQGVAEGQYFNRAVDQMGSGIQVPIADPLYAQYVQGASDSVTQAAARLDPSFARNALGTSHMDLAGYQKAYLETLIAQQRLQYGMPYFSKSGGLNPGYYGSTVFDVGMPYQGSPLSSSVLSSLGLGSPLRHSEQLSRFPAMARSNAGGSVGSWNLDNSSLEEGFASSLLDEFKNNKTRSFDLSDIADHVVEFSMDQYGSRFIQQKLETAPTEEKNKIFPEILPHARSLMTDVFGNYVIQKFFEHGTEIQRKQLASQLTGHVLPLSLQMYGCRVIQKALEVVDIDQQTKMVLELEGSIMKCVRDQNGNHVIQKCIECVPQERIQFIIKTFYGQVVALSTHPYGCRVIQRVLEHCDDPETQSIMMEEILKSVCMLAQDQYGNYVVQHVLQHGKPEERSAIICMLIGQIVKMSQQKFASNVVEKCLTFGRPEERQLLINEMLGSTDENEPLQAMMKDQFGNYVVQKVLETCDDRNRELILSRIKVHLNALKKYTYGKHIVTRVEKLVAAGERHIGIASYSS